MFVDAHFHPGLKGFTPEKITEYLDREKIDQIWLFSWEELNPPIPELYRHISVEEILEAYHHDPDRIVPFYAPDPTQSDVCDRLTRYAEKGIKGYGELKVTARWSDPEITKMLECLRKQRFPIVFHNELSRYHYMPNSKSYFDRQFGKLMNGAFNGVSRLYIDQFVNATGLFRKKINRKLKYFPGYMLDMAEFEQQLQAFPDVTFIAHGPLFWKAIAPDYSPVLKNDKGKIREKGVSVRLLEEYDNLYADISGNSGFNALNRDHEFTKWFLEHLPHKLLYGTDNYLLGQKELINAFELSEDKKKLILGDNAYQILYQEKETDQ
ncbi:MAG: amidohydrolase family protein [Bacteroidota bacterium]